MYGPCADLDGDLGMRSLARAMWREIHIAFVDVQDTEMTGKGGGQGQVWPCMLISEKQARRKKIWTRI
jgi:hypothetical protein